MDSVTLAHELADPIGSLGMQYYFDKGTSAYGKTLGLDVVSFYFLGRGGVLGDRTPQEVDDTFYFFKTGMVAGMYQHASSLYDREAGVRDHLVAARDFANRTFGGVDDTVLTAFHDAARVVINAAPRGHWPIFDGYRDLITEGTLVENAYLDTVLLRELRGGVHTDAVKAAGLTPLLSCYLDRGGAYFQLHGFGEDDVPTVTDEDRARREAVEADTTVRSAALFALLSDEQRDALATGSAALQAALASPVAVG